ncbi:MAG: serine/threonine protein kinase, partial [Planctomycetota bacterium]
MTPEELYAVWLRRLAGRTPAAGEKRELLQAMESDPELRSRILADAEIDGLLKMLGTTEHDAEGFVKAVSDFLSAEADAGGFVGRVESRMAREGILPVKTPSEADRKKLRSGFENAGNMQYNSTRAGMPAIVTLEGSEEDFSHLLVHHRIINPDQLQQALEDRQSHAAKGHPVESLRDVLLRTKVVSSPLVFEVLRTATKVVETCIKCTAVHHIFYYHPSARYFCTYCKGPLRVIDPGQSMTWKPGELAASIKELHAPMAEAPEPAAQSESKIILPKSAANPLDDPSIASLSADETMLDMGVTPRSSSKPAASKPAPPPPPPAPAPVADGLPSWMNDEPTMGSLPAADETMLDMGATPRSSSKPAPLPKLAKEGEPEKKPAPPPQKSGMVPGQTTMLDMGAVGQKPPADPTQSIVAADDAGTTMLDMGPLSGNTPPKKHVADLTTSVMGSKRALPAGLPKPPPETPKLPTETNSYDVTTRAASKPDATFLVSPSSGVTPRTATPFSSTDKTQVQHTTPKSGGSSAAAIANAKALPPEVAAAAKDPNRVFGKYILMSELGRGGAGVVYKAWDTLLIQYVALKFIRNQDDTEGDTESGSSQIEEFQREARMSVRLRHPNIVRIYELGCMSNRYYLSMEYIEGGNLLALIHGGKDRNLKTRFNADPLKFLKIMQNIALAVDYAHNTKPPIIHRDLKPHNVLVDTKGNPYVVDFGLAKEVDAGEGTTLTGVVKGTPTYMAPEQAEGRNRDVD